MGLTDLSSEIQVLIFNYILPDDLVSYSLSCKKVYEHAGKRLGQHRQWLRRYKNPIVIDGGVDNETQSAVKWLYEIQEDPWIVHYIYEIEIYPGMNIQPTPGMGEPDCAGTRQMLGQLDFEALASELPPDLDLGSNQDEPSWKEKVVSHGDRRSAFTLLAALLPKLESILFKGLMYELQELRDLATAVAHWTDKGWDKQGYRRPLANVTSIRVEHWDTEGGEPFGSIGSLVLLPSLRNIGGRMILADEHFEVDEESVSTVVTPSTRSPSPPSAPVISLPQSCVNKISPVKEVDFWRSVISPQALYEFIMPMHDLEKLEYEHGDSTVGGPPEEDFDTILYRRQFVNIAGDWLKEHDLVAKIPKLMGIRQDVLRLRKFDPARDEVQD